jgi:hypothetical protein
MTEDQERTTREVIDTLSEDCDRCHSELVEAIDAGQEDEDGGVTANYEYHARQLIRAIFAYLEAVTFSVKAWSANHCMENEIPITPQERYFATDTEYEINQKGEIVEAAAKISLSKNIRFAIAMNRKAHGIEVPFDASVEWWSCLKQAIKVRDRLTHPKLPGDLDVSGNDIINALKARSGFEDELLRFGQA